MSLEIPTTMQAALFTAPHTELQIVTVPVPEPNENQVLVKVAACGVCHGDSVVEDGYFPGSSYPRIPGHEIVGHIVKKGGKVPSNLSLNQLVGVGWHDKHCFNCTTCKKGEFNMCLAGGLSGTGITRDGGYAQYAVVNWEALVIVPEEWASQPAKAAPLLCAGLTVYNGLRKTDIVHGEIVVIQGVGGLGHLAVQYAARLGYYPIALTTSPSKHKGALELGAKEVLTITEDGAYVKRIQQLGGAKVIIATGPDAKGIADLIPALAPGGSLLLASVPSTPISVPAMSLVVGQSKIVGLSSGGPNDAEETLRVSHLVGVQPLIETFPLAKAAEAYKSMMENKVRFRAVILPNA